MTSIAIVGAGQAGLQLALGLQSHGYEVTVLSNRTPEDIFNGKVMSSQGMFDRALATERKLGIDFWQDDTPQLEGIAVNIVGPDGDRALLWTAPLHKPGQCVDQRLKFPRWMDEFSARGGDLRLVEAGVEELEKLAENHDLVVVAAGKGAIASMFERDPERSPYDAPQRSLALTYVTGMSPHDLVQGVSFTLMPGVGEYFTAPALTTTGLCDMMIFEGIPGGPMDRWHEVSSPEEHLACSLEILQNHAPWEYERSRDSQLTDPNGILAGRFPPTVRRPVATLPSGRPVLGAADVVVLNDPITGQGSNNAATCADIYMQSIIDAGAGPFDRDWMNATFDRYWDYVQWPTRWTNMLLQPPKPHVMALLGAAAESPRLAADIGYGFNDASTLFPWWEDPEAAEQKIVETAAAPETAT
jgi:2-polyprenyl-6-methoxyphenol hydroxylase-like FAD-dependent oxidoreductase